MRSISSIDEYFAILRLQYGGLDFTPP